MQSKLTLGIERPSEMVRLNNRPYPHGGQAAGSFGDARDPLNNTDAVN
jgi:hypothetical protein